MTVRYMLQFEVETQASGPRETLPAGKRVVNSRWVTVVVGSELE
jgi:hypothetical protein